MRPSDDSEPVEQALKPDGGEAVSPMAEPSTEIESARATPLARRLAARVAAKSLEGRGERIELRLLVWGQSNLGDPRLPRPYGRHRVAGFASRSPQPRRPDAACGSSRSARG